MRHLLLLASNTLYNDAYLNEPSNLYECHNFSDPAKTGKVKRLPEDELTENIFTTERQTTPPTAAVSNAFEVHA